MTARRIVLLLALLLTGSVAWGAAVTSTDEGNVPSVVTDTTRPRQCVFAYLVVDSGNNDMFVSRQQVASGPDETANRGRFPCPTQVPTRVATRALESCSIRTADQKLCVYGDMARGFEARPDIRQTAENTSRCASDLANYIGIACWDAGERNVCNVACGGTEQEAIDLARGRCEVKQQKRCPITGAMEILPPQ